MAGKRNRHATRSHQKSTSRRIAKVFRCAVGLVICLCAIAWATIPTDAQESSLDTIRRALEQTKKTTLPKPVVRPEPKGDNDDKQSDDSTATETTANANDISGAVLTYVVGEQDIKVTVIMHEPVSVGLDKGNNNIVFATEDHGSWRVSISGGNIDIHPNEGGVIRVRGEAAWLSMEGEAIVTVRI